MRHAPIIEITFITAPDSNGTVLPICMSMPLIGSLARLITASRALLNDIARASSLSGTTPRSIAFEVLPSRPERRPSSMARTISPAPPSQPIRPSSPAPPNSSTPVADQISSSMRRSQRSCSSPPGIFVAAETQLCTALTSEACAADPVTASTISGIAKPAMLAPSVPDVSATSHGP